MLGAAVGRGAAAALGAGLALGGLGTAGLDCVGTADVAGGFVGAGAAAGGLDGGRTGATGGGGGWATQTAVTAQVMMIQVAMAVRCSAVGRTAQRSTATASVEGDAIGVVMRSQRD